MNKKDSSNFKRNLFDGIIIFIIAISSLVLLMYISDVKLEETALTNLQEAANEKQIELNTEFNSIQNELLSMASTLEDYGLNEAQVIDFLQKRQKLFNFDSIYFVGTNLLGISETGELREFSENFFDNANIDNEVYVLEPYISEITSNQVLGIQTPIYVEGKIEGYVFAEYDLADIKLSLENEIQEFGYAVFTSSENRDFFTTNVTFLTEKEMENLTFENKSTDFEIIENNIATGQSGTLTFKLSNREMVAVYSPLVLNDWTLLLAVDKYMYVADIRTLSTVLLATVIGIITGFMYFIFYFLSAKKTIENKAYYDDLTQLPNLAKFKLELKNAIELNNYKNMAVIKMDINNFKAINEMYDFEIGNNVLCAFKDIADICKERESSFILARTGADEFIIFAANGFLIDVKPLINEFEAYIKNKVPQLKNHYTVLKFGRYIFDRYDEDVNSIVSKVEMAHGMSKATEDTLIWDYDEKFKTRILKQTQITNDMELALQNEEFVPYFQPKININNNELSGAEALVRWIKPDGSMVFPNDFIPVFESNGFITKLDKYILSKVCETLKTWEKNGHELITISVNFSRSHFKNPNFINEIIEIVDSYKLERKYIEIELTETIVTENEGIMKKLLNEIKEEGFKVSIDDFGTGYSSLGMLKSIKVDTLKLDRSFILVSEEDKESSKLVIDGIIKLAHNLNMNTVAEGVETSDQLDFLKSLNCNIAQGYYHSKPISSLEFKEKYFS